MATKLQLGPINFTPSSPDVAPRDIISIIEELSSSGVAVHFANAYTVALAHRDADYRQMLNDSAFVFPDGRPVAWMSRLLHKSPRLFQVRGPQFFRDVFDASQQAKVKHYLLGSTPQVLEALTANLKREFPAAQIVGSYSPPFRSMTDEERSAQDVTIATSGANLVWVGLGTPKQDFEVARLANALPVAAIAIGAAFDFAAGTKNEAPRWLSPLGLEWIFRLLSEPRRLWKRYLFGNITFVRACLSRQPDEA